MLSAAALPAHSSSAPSSCDGLKAANLGQGCSEQAGFWWWPLWAQLSSPHAGGTMPSRPNVQPHRAANWPGCGGMHSSVGPTALPRLHARTLSQNLQLTDLGRRSSPDGTRPPPELQQLQERAWRISTDTAFYACRMLSSATRLYACRWETDALLCRRGVPGDGLPALPTALFRV